MLRLAYSLALLSILFTEPLMAAESTAAEPQDLAFSATIDGSEQRYVQILPPNYEPETPCDLMIALHGHGSDRWQFAKQNRDECRAVRDVAAAHGMILIAPDYRARTSWMGPAAEADMVQLVGLLRERFRIRNIVWAGASMGGTSVLTFATLHPDLAQGVVSMNGLADHVTYTGFPEAIAASFGSTKEASLAEYEKRSALRHADKLTMPVAFTAGGKDTIVPPDSVRELHERLVALGTPTQMEFRPDVGHLTGYADAKAALLWVIERLPETAK